MAEEAYTGNTLDIPSPKMLNMFTGKKGIQFDNLEEVEEHARSAMSKVAYAYYSTGADDNITLVENKKAWRTLRIVPRVLIDVDSVSTTCQMLGAQQNLIFTRDPPGIQASTTLGRISALN